ncbi:anti-sigma factor family protein [Pseudonocardia abyssalis]|jgi:anti-sigma factor RsiW|uniref:Zf-HC2 domain-containing protein n=1 Tax=Pseudonocardia abyssalis TaxID=2792008 RepID=A0ABS6UW01_9PSEU|nr:zf-HC2 domain-containing protein [Pseudonocardia abyssalis]MBW0115894.1 zf-HC2 domain-containing protein [Pseudonocardia abyssalis]MBW0136435.1 zf-HC2 domain-containing protein [Pseudonocardia abyssalis]
MSERRLFTVNTSDWGQTHLTSDAVVAFVDDELAQRPHARATQHVAACPDCAAEVVAQRQARTALRGASCPSLPTSLLSALRAIPQDTDLPDVPAGLAVSTEGQLVSVLRADAVPADAVPADTGRPGFADGQRTHGARPAAARRLRLGAGVAAASGIAIGALAFGTAALPSVPGPTADRGVLGGSVLGVSGVVPARLGLDATTAAEDARLGGLRAPRTFLRHGLR